MIETIQLKVTSPPVNLPGLSAAVRELKELDQLLDRLSTRPAVAVKGFENSASAIGRMSDYAKLTEQSFDRLGEKDPAAKMRAGFRTLSEELEYLDAQAKRLQASLAGAPSGAQRATNPAVANKIANLESALASVNLRRNEIRKGLPSDVSSQVQFDRDATAMVAAEKRATGAAGEATGALRAQQAVVESKAGSMGQLAAANESVAAAERRSTTAVGENALMSERWIETNKGRFLAESQFRTGIGETRRVLGENGDVIVDQINHLERYKDALRANTVEFANRRAQVTKGSREEIQLLQDEAAARERIGGQFREFAGTPEDQGNKARAAALRRRASDIAQTQQRQADAELDRAGTSRSEKLREQAEERANAQANAERVRRFRSEQAGFGGQTETFEKEDASGSRVKRTTVRRESGDLRESISLLQQYDAQGRLVSATISEQSKQMDNLGRTTQSTLVGTVGMAAKFIAIYRGLDLGIQVLKAGVDSTIEFERKLATLQIVFHGNVQESRQLALAVLDQAAAFGQDGVAALDVATDFARFGLSQTEVLEAVRVATIAANVAQLDLGQSGKYLQSIYSGYQLNVGQLAGVLGSLDTVSHKFNVTNLQLLDGLSRVAPLAKQAGVGLNELVGFEAVITGRTARPGSEAGNAIKSLISRLAKPTTQGALQDIAGVNVKDEAGDVKSASQVINELFVAYQDLGQAERQELLIRLAGTQQASRIAALLEGYLKSQELAVNASRDLSRADRENIAVRATLSSQLKTVATDWEKFWVASASPGLAGGAQNNLIEIVKSVGNVLSVLTAAESLAARQSQRGGKQGQLLNAGLDAFAASNPLDLAGRARGFNRDIESAKKIAERFGFDGFGDDADKATKSLIRFNAEVDKLSKAGEADQAASRIFTTVDKLIDSASPEKLENMLRIVSRVAAGPTDLQGQEKVRAELNALAKSNDYLGLHARLAQLAKEADADRTRQLEAGNKRLDERLGKETANLNVLNEQRNKAGRTGNKAEADKLDEEIDEQESRLSQLRIQRTRGLQDLFPEGEEPYGYDAEAPKKDAERRKAELAARFKGIEDVSKGYPTSDRQTQAADGIERDLQLVKAKAREVDRVREEQVQKAQEARERLRSQVTEPDPIEAEQQRQTIDRVQQNIISGVKEEAAEQRRALDAERDKLEALRAYAQLQDAVRRGAQLGRIQTPQFQIGRNETERDLNEAGGILTQLLPRTRFQFDSASRAGDVRGQAAAQAESLELVNRLGALQLSLEERRYKIASDIVNARRQEAEEASKALQTASREDQLRAAMVARFVQNRGGRGFSANEFQFLDRATQEAITRFNPQAAPPTLPTRSAELQREQLLLEQALTGITKAIQTTAAAIESAFGRNPVTNPNPSAPSLQPVTLPGGVQPPPINLQFSEQFKVLTAAMGDLVNARLDGEIAGIRTEVRGFMNTLRLPQAQSAASAAI